MTARPLRLRWLAWPSAGIWALRLHNDIGPRATLGQVQPFRRKAEFQRQKSFKKQKKCCKTTHLELKSLKVILTSLIDVL